MSPGFSICVPDMERADSGVLTIAVNEFDEHLAELAERGVPSAPLIDGPGAGTRKVALNDPDGNTISFFENPRGEN